MKVLNKPTLIFLFVIFIIFFGIFQFLQSPKLAELISEHITENVFTKRGLKVEFEKVDLQLFPPTTYFTNIEFSKEEDDDGIGVFLKAKKLGFHFGLLDFLSSKFIVSKISLYDALLKASIKTEKGEPFKFTTDMVKKFKIKEIQQAYIEKIYKKIPFILRELELDEVRVKVNKEDFLIDKLNLSLFKRSFRVKGRFEELKYYKFTGFKANEQEMDFDVNITKNKIKINKFDAKNREDRVAFSGEFQNGGPGIVINGSVSLIGRIENFVKNLNLLKDPNSIKGLVVAKVVLSKDILNPDVKLKARFFDLISKYEKVQRLMVEAEKTGEKVAIEKLTIQDRFAELDLKKPLIVKDYKKIDFQKLKGRFVLKNFPTEVALYYVKSLSPIKGSFNGELDIFLDNRDIHFKIVDGFQLNNFKLIFPGTKIPLLKNKRITAKKGEVIIKDNGDVSVNFDFRFPNSRIVIAGEVLDSKDSLSFKTEEGTIIDFKELGPIAGVNIEGVGPTNIVVSGPNDNVVINLSPKLDNFSVLDFKLGKAEGDIDYLIELNKLDIKKLDSNFGKTSVKGKGYLTFGDSPSIDLKIEKEKATYQDSLKMYHTLLENLDLIPEGFDLNYQSSFQIKGPLDLDKMIISGHVKTGANIMYGEEVDGSNLKFKFHKNNIKIYDLKINEGKGVITGEFDYNLKNYDLRYKAKINGVRTTDVEIINKANLGLEGFFEGDLVGARKKNSFKSKNNLKIVKSTIGENKVPDSTIEILTEGKKAFVKGDFLGEKITFNSVLNLNKKDSKNQSNLNLLVKSKNIKELLGFLSVHNMVDEELEGAIEIELKSDFNLFNIKKFNAELDFKEFNLRKGDIKLSLAENARKISVNNGKIKFWDLTFKDEHNSVSFKGEGDFNHNFKIRAKHGIDAEIFKILSPNLKVAKGYSEGEIIFIGNKKEIITNILWSGNLDKLSIYGIPNYFEDISFNLSLENKDLLIQKFHGRYGKGELGLSGDLTLDYPTPQVDVDYQFNNIKLPIMNLKKSFILASGRGSLKGEEAPYDLKGNYSIVYGDLRNEVNEYYPSVQSSTFYEKYLPKELIKKTLPYLNFDLDVNITSPVEMTNTLAEILFDGRVLVTGTSEKPIFNGVLRVVPDKSKIIFKANEFNLSVGELKLVNTPIDNPEINFAGTAKIKEYDIKFEFSGVTDNISIDFSSDPFLSNEDILSLLTLGITSEDSEGLSESERTAITSVGLGTLLADQLKINQGLSSGLGLRLSVIPEVEEETDYSGGEGREGVINPYATRYKSATSVQVKKQITTDLNLSISSRIGGSIDQKQTMSADYYINKNMSLEGVYELKTTPDANISNITNAFGADLIFRWSFK